jgi:aminomethyltransferase
MTTLQQTALHAQHIAAGAKMVPFAGWHMPVQYQGVIAEHCAVRENVGMFDVSHMGEFRVVGSDALTFLQYVTVNDVSKLQPGRAHYNMLPNEHGGLVDDIYIYCLAPLYYLVVVNASNIEKDLAHLQTLAHAYNVVVENHSSRYALLALQGPQTATLLQPYLELDLSTKRKNDVFEVRLFDTSVTLARTGYTGEDGFEIFCSPETVSTVWQHLLGLGVTPCGLGARDTLRLEAGFPLYDHEFNDDTSPLHTPFAWAVKMHKDFYGKAAMLSRPRDKSLVALRVLERGIPREGYKVMHQEHIVGKVTSGTLLPNQKIGVALAYVRQEFATLSQRLDLEIRGTTVPVEVTKPRFLKETL